MVSLLVSVNQNIHYKKYCIVCIFGGIKNSKFGELLIFCGWQILIWRIGRHMSLSMRTVNENGGLNFGKW